MDDNSNSFGSAVAMSGVSNVGVGESVIFIEVSASATSAEIAAIKAEFIDTWLGGHPPVGGHVAVFGNISGNANAEFEIILDNNHTLQAADFLL